MTPPASTFDVVGAITEGMTGIVDSVLPVIGAVAPGAIAILGAVITIRVGIGIVRSLVRA